MSAVSIWVKREMKNEAETTEIFYRWNQESYRKGCFEDIFHVFAYECESVFWLVCFFHLLMWLHLGHGVLSSRECSRSSGQWQWEDPAPPEDKAKRAEGSALKLNQTFKSFTFTLSYCRVLENFVSFLVSFAVRGWHL